MSRLKPSFLGWMQPEHPCREMPTRHCPTVYDAVCGDDRPCARYESDDETPWLPEVYDTTSSVDHPER